MPRTPTDSACRTCELTAARSAGASPIWDAIVRTAHWDLVHALDTDLEGWLVLVHRVHIATVAEMADDAAAELGPLVRDVSRALEAVLGCAKTYVIQLAENPSHRHVHVHVIARPADLDDADRGPRVFRRLGVPPGDTVPEARRDEIALALRPHLARWSALPVPAGGPSAGGEAGQPSSAQVKGPA